MLLIVVAIAFRLALQALGQGHIVIPQPRPHEPDVFSVCACDFGDQYFLHLISALMKLAPNGFHAHVGDSKLHAWLGSIQCDPWPMGSVDQAVAHAVKGSPFWDDYRYGRRYHYLDKWIRDDYGYQPRIGLATRAACLPGRLLLSLVCVHQALLPALRGQEVDWHKIGEKFQSMQDWLELATGKGSYLDLGHCAALWPWAPIFGGSRLKSFKDYLHRLLSGGHLHVNPSMPATAAYTEPFKISPSEHAEINPYLQPCVPLSHCWPHGLRAKLTANEQCEYCCNPAHGYGGDPSCFGASSWAGDPTFTYEACCNPMAGQEAPAARTPSVTFAQAQPDPQGIGNPQCFDPVYSFQRCCNPDLGPSGDPSCFDGAFTFQVCCTAQSATVGRTQQLLQHVPTETKPMQQAPAATVTFTLDPDGVGNPMCFDPVYSFKRCCSADLGPSGDPSCFDGQFTFQVCCMVQSKQLQARTETLRPKQAGAEAGQREQGLDKSEHCAAWARQGECGKNKAYMMRNCQKTCDCHDGSEHCEAWAKSGECTTNAAFMLKKCRKACDKC